MWQTAQGVFTYLTKPVQSGFGRCMLVYLWINFTSLPAAACLLDPSLAAVLHAAKTYIVQQECGCLPASAVQVPAEWRPDSIISCTQPLSVLAIKMTAEERSASSAANSADTAVTELARYVTGAAEAGAVSAPDFWSNRRAIYSTPVSCHLLKTCLQLQHRRLRWARVFTVRLADCWTALQNEPVVGNESISEAECTHRTLASTLAKYCTVHYCGHWWRLWWLACSRLLRCEQVCISTGIKFLI